MAAPDVVEAVATADEVAFTPVDVALRLVLIDELDGMEDEAGITWTPAELHSCMVRVWTSVLRISTPLSNFPCLLLDPNELV